MNKFLGWFVTALHNFEGDVALPLAVRYKWGGGLKRQILAILNLGALNT